MTNHNDSESPTHKPDICIYYSVPIFQYVLMFHYFQFIRLLNARNCFIITFSFNNFIHELTVWFKDASWYKYLAHRRCILYGFLLLITTLFLLNTVYLYDENLGLMAFLFLRVNSINVKGNIFSKFSNKCCTYPQVRMFFCSLL